MHRVKSLFGAKPHTIKAAGMGAPDNGKRPPIVAPVAYEYDTEAVGTGVRGLEM